MGEGAGCIILEELDHAKARGAKIYAEMVGEYECRCLSSYSYHPEGLGAYNVMKYALEDSGLSPADLTYHVHGTSTPVGDPSEVKAILKLFGDMPD